MIFFFLEKYDQRRGHCILERQAVMPLKCGPLNPVAGIDCTRYPRKRKTEIFWRVFQETLCLADNSSWQS